MNRSFTRPSAARTAYAPSCPFDVRFTESAPSRTVATSRARRRSIRLCAGTAAVHRSRSSERSASRTPGVSRTAGNNPTNASVLVPRATRTSIGRRASHEKRYCRTARGSSAALKPRNTPRSAYACRARSAERRNVSAASARRRVVAPNRSVNLSGSTTCSRVRSCPAHQAETAAGPRTPSSPGS